MLMLPALSTAVLAAEAPVVAPTELETTQVVTVPLAQPVDSLLGVQPERGPSGVEVSDHHGLLVASLVFHTLSFGTTATALAMSRVHAVGPNMPLFAMGLVSLPLSAVGAGLLLVPSLSGRSDSALFPVLAVSSAAIAALGVVGLGMFFGDLSWSDESYILSAVAAIVTPGLATPLGLMGLGLERRMRTGSLRPQLSVLPQRGGAQVAMQLSF